MTVPEPEMRSSPEFDLIARARELFRPTVEASARVVLGAGDDAAVTVPGAATATSVDAIVDGVHFRSAWCPPRAVGRKALAAALSDLAAMGAEAGEAYVWLGAPADFGDDECLALCAGIAELALEQGVAILGGDLTAAPALSIAVTVVGHGGRLVGRGGGGPAEVVCVTGALGGAGAALLALENPELGTGLADERRSALLAAQLAPAPRIAAGRALAAAGATAMIDISDGLGADAEQLAAASAIALEIDLGRLPVAEGVEEVATAAGHDPLELAASAGEDYELLCLLPAPAVTAAEEALGRIGVALTEIGSARAGAGVALRLPGGRALPVRGHDHRR